MQDKSISENISVREYFPKRMKLLGKNYLVELMLETDDYIKFMIVRANNKYEPIGVVNRYRMEKNDWYINLTFFDRIVVRNFETYMYMKECKEDRIVGDDRIPVFYKYWNKWRMLSDM